VVQPAERVVLRVNLRLHPIEVDVPSESEGRAMVEAMGLDETQSLASFWFNAGSRTERGSSYRAAAPTIEVLWRIVEDRKLPIGERVPAAIALRSSLDDDGRIRLHASADSCADSRARAALYAAAGAADEVLEATLDDIDEAERPEKARG